MQKFREVQTMRRYIIIPVLAGLLGLSVIFFIAGLADSQKNNLQITETVLYGSRSAADSLSVKLQAKDSGTGSNFWELDYTLQSGGKLAKQSSFSRETAPERETSADFPQIFTLDAENYAGWFTTAAEARQAYPYLKEAIDSAAGSTAPGGTSKQTVRLKDYLKYLPLTLNSESADLYFTLTQSRGKGGDSLDLSLFNTPVPENYTLDIEVKKNSDGAVTQVSVESTQTAVQFDPDGQGLLLKEGAFIAASRLNRTEGTEKTEYHTAFVYPENRRGIFFIPYDKDSEGATTKYLDMERAELAFPLKENAEVLSLTERPQTDELLLFTGEGDEVIVTVIDRKTMKEKHRQVMLHGLPADRTFLTFENYETCALACNDSGKGSYAFLYEDEDGYSVIQCSLANIKGIEEHSGGGSYLRPYAAAVKDEKAAVLFFNTEYIDTALDHYLLVCDKDQILYAGSYEYSLSASDYGKYEAQIILNSDKYRPAVITMED